MAATNLLTQAINTALYAAAGDGNYYGLTPSGNNPPLGLPAISGTPAVGQVLSCSVLGVSDPDGIGEISYQWKKSGANIGGAISATYTPVTGDIGYTITVEINYTDDKGNIETLESNATSAITGSSSTINVGSARTYTTLIAGYTAANEGDTIYVDAGTYPDEFIYFEKSVDVIALTFPVNFTVSNPTLVASNPAGQANKGLFILGNSASNIISVSFTDVDVSGVLQVGVQNNWSPFRNQNCHLTLTRCDVHDNEDGILSDNSNPNITQTIVGGSFVDNGARDSGGFTHQIYANGASLSISGGTTFSNQHSTNVGHHVKSRCQTNNIGNAVFNAGYESYSIDVPNGGDGIIEDNVIYKGPNANNVVMINYGGEGSPQTGPLTIQGNYFFNTNTGSNYGIKNYDETAENLVVQNNYYSGLASFTQGANITASNNTDLGAVTTLQTTAAAMAVGEWVELPTTGWDDTLLVWGGHNGLEYGINMVYDPVQRKVHAFLEGHLTKTRHIIFDELTATWSWQTMPDCSHEYGHTAIDLDHRKILVTQNLGSQVISIYDIDTNTWSVSSDPGIAYAGDSATMLAYFPPLGKFISPFVYDTLGTYLSTYDAETDTWGSISRPAGYLSNTYGASIVDPVNDLYIYGSGTQYGVDSYNTLWVMDSAQNITAATNAPRDISCGGTHITVDPVTGEILLFWNDSGEVGTKHFYSYNAPTDTWAALSTASIPFDAAYTSNQGWGLVATPIAAYGVVMYATYNSLSGGTKIYLYKHA